MLIGNSVHSPQSQKVPLAQALLDNYIYITHTHIYMLYTHLLFFLILTRQGRHSSAEGVSVLLDTVRHHPYD